MYLFKDLAKKCCIVYGVFVTVCHLTYTKQCICLFVDNYSLISWSRDSTLRIWEITPTMKEVCKAHYQHIAYFLIRFRDAASEMYSIVHNVSLYFVGVMRTFDPCRVVCSGMMKRRQSLRLPQHFPLLNPNWTCPEDTRHPSLLILSSPNNQFKHWNKNSPYLT